MKTILYTLSTLIIVLLAYLVLIIGIGIPVQYLWNRFLVEIIPVTKISLLQAGILIILVNLIQLPGLLNTAKRKGKDCIKIKDDEF